MPQTGKDKKLAAFNIDISEWEEFKVKARENKTNASKLLQRFVREYIGKLPVLPESENEVVNSGRITQLERAIVQLTAEVAEIKKAG